MKRYISLALAAVILVFSLAVPSYASELDSLDNFNFVNVLDYTDLGMCNVSGSDPFSINIALPSKMFVQYIDFIILDRTGGIFSADLYCYGVRVPLTVVSLGNGYYRIFGKVNWEISSLDLKIDHANGGYKQLYFCSLYVSLSDVNHYSAPLVCQGFTPSSDVDLSLHTGDNRPTQVLWTIDSFNDRTFSFTCYSPDWYKYDYLDFQVIASVSEFTSISAVFGETAIPFTVSKIFPANTDGNSYCISVRLDLRGLDRNSSDVPEVTIVGQSNYDGANGFQLAGCSGYIIQRDINPLFYYFKKLTSDISSFFSNLGSTVSTWGQNVFNAVTSVGSKIETWGQKIFNSLNPDSGAADDAINQGSQAADQLTDLTDQMNSLEKPDLSGAGDISAIISPGDLSSYTVFLSTVVNAPYISQVVMLSLILSLAAYVLFGKR